MPALGRSHPLVGFEARPSGWFWRPGWQPGALPLQSTDRRIKQVMPGLATRIWPRQFGHAALIALVRVSNIPIGVGRKIRSRLGPACS